MKEKWKRAAVVALLVAGLPLRCGPAPEVLDGGGAGPVALPAPRGDGPLSVEGALASRRSVRAYRKEPLTLAELGQLLWAAQGITAHWGGRSAPSAGATYPLEVFAVVGEVEGLAPGVYQYQPKGHGLLRRKTGDVRAELSRAALGQAWVREASVVLVLAARYERTTQRYGERGVRYVHLEVGHAGQNIYLQATALGLGTVAVGAFSDEEVQRLLGIEEAPLYLMPVGRPAS